jgi:hypothetical protein
MSARCSLKNLRKYCLSDTELGLFPDYQFPGHITVSDDSVSTVCMGGG